MLEFLSVGDEATVQYVKVKKRCKRLCNEEQMVSKNDATAMLCGRQIKRKSVCCETGREKNRRGPPG